MQEQLRNKINSYLSSNDNRPLIVDFSCAEARESFLQTNLLIPKIDVCEFVHKGKELPEIAELYEYMENCKEEKIIITNLGIFLKLFGQDFLRQNIHTLLEKSFTTKFLILTFQCAKYLNERSPRNRAKIIADTGKLSASSSLVFIDSQYKNYVSAEPGLSSALRKAEIKSGEKIYVLTDYRKSDFSSALFNIEECQNAYDLLCLRDSAAKKIKQKYGSLKDWNILLEKLRDDSIEQTISKYINTKNFIKNIEDWQNKDDFEKWLTFIYAKLNNIKTENWAVNYAMDKSNKSSEVLKKIYDSILDLNYKENEYWNKYIQRKQILEKIKDDTVIYEYCNYVQYKNEDALYYLTDNTDNEKKLIIQLIDKYYQHFTKSKLLSLLQKTYKDLYDYLSYFNMGDELLNNYFSEYKYLKVINHLTPEFKEIVDREACKRSYKKILMYRSEKLEEMIFDNSVIYFVDALGVEFLSYIEKKCVEKNLAMKANITKANLPSITSENTEFRDFFAKKNIQLINEKELDILIHEGKNDYDFDKNKLPIHIIEEFQIIDRVLTNIKSKLKSSFYEKAIIVSDHGATRLAIINTDMVKIDVDSTGEHGGRVCQVYPGMEVIPNAVIENNYCILGDYNSFKGGRVGRVEMHGGATLEEVVVPIIEITLETRSIEIKVITEIVKASFKTTAVLKFYLNKKLSNVTVHINGAIYSAISSDGFNYSAELKDIKKSGEYEFEVWSDDKLISSRNVFKVEKESAKTNNLWE